MMNAYLDTLTETLSFDRALARCVVQEVEDHLSEAIAADRGPDRAEAERRAIANIGDPHALAAEFALVSLARRTRRIGIAVVLAVLAVLVAMKARIAWYASLQWTMGEDARALAATVISIDRYAFWLAAITGIGALLYVARNRVRTAVPAYRAGRRRAFLLFGCAIGALVVSVVSDGVLTALQLGTELSASSAIPIATMAAEIACVGAVAVLIVNTMRRAASMEGLLKE
jgi:hypothetical protein